MKKLMMVMILAVAANAAFMTSAAVPAFSYQGVIKEVGGSVPQNKNRTVEFRIYDGPTAKTPLWGRAYSVLLDANGLFNIAITDAAGSEIVPSISLEKVLAVYAGKTLYIGLTVDHSSGEISPRQALLAVPYAIHAADAAAASGDFTVEGETTLMGTLAVRGAMNAGAISATSLSVNGNISAGTGGTISGYGSMPKGGIIMWSGSASNIPDGWALCNGQKVNGVATPDLRDRFIAGAGNLYGVGDKGGEMSVTLTAAQMPRHYHEYAGDDQLYGIEPGCTTMLRETMTKYDADSTTGNNWHSKVYATSYAGNSQAHENRPPFYALCFIIRVK